MSFEKALEGAVTFIDRQSKTLGVTQEISRKESVPHPSVSFIIAPNASVISNSRGVLKLAALKIGQKVLVHYVTEAGERRVAHTITVIEPTTKDTSFFAGVRVAT